MRVFLFILFMFLQLPAQAGLSLIRDAEIEQTMRDYATPIFEAAGLNSSSVKIYIINDSSINAFVAGGQNLFINTGLITESNNANMLIGVIAHEAGHIAAGHIVKRGQELEDLSVQTLLSTVLGAAVSIAGLPEAGTAIMAGGQHIFGRDFLQYTREQEVSADQLGLNYLKKTNQSAQGLLELMQILRRQQTLNFDQLDPYAISHPLSQQRVGHIRANIDESIPESSPIFDAQHARIAAKIDGFIEKPEYVLAKYKDDSVPSLYARSIAYYRQSNLPESLENIDNLLRQYPDDIYFNELKGQILFENGQIANAEKYYSKAVKLKPDSALLNFDLGKVYISAGNLKEAVNYLQKSAKIEPQNSSTWRLLAKAYGQQDNIGMLNLTLAEEAYILGSPDKASAYAKIAKENLDKNSASWLRANDLINDIKFQKDK